MRQSDPSEGKDGIRRSTHPLLRPVGLHFWGVRRRIVAGGWRAVLRGGAGVWSVVLEFVDLDCAGEAIEHVHTNIGRNLQSGACSLVSSSERDRRSSSSMCSGCLGGVTRGLGAAVVGTVGLMADRGGPGYAAYRAAYAGTSGGGLGPGAGTGMPPGWGTSVNSGEAWGVGPGTGTGAASGSDMRVGWASMLWSGMAPGGDDWLVRGDGTSWRGEGAREGVAGTRWAAPGGGEVRGVGGGIWRRANASRKWERRRKASALRSASRNTSGTERRFWRMACARSSRISRMLGAGPGVRRS